MDPEVASSSFNTKRPTVVFPQPDSPTSPSVCPGAIEKLTSFTARTISGGWPKSFDPPDTTKCLVRPSTFTSGGTSERCVLCFAGPTAVESPIARGPCSANSLARMQAEKWPGSTSSKGGCAVLQALTAAAQRGAKRQPCGGETRFGGRPSIVSSLASRGLSSRGTERKRP